MLAVAARANRHHQDAERLAAERVAGVEAESDKLVALPNSNIELTRQDKEPTEQVAALAREIHTRLTGTG